MKGQIFKYLAVVAITVSAALVASCGDDDKDAVTSYTLTTTASPLTDGTVTRNPNKEKYAAGDKVTITATANDGFIFDGWENGDTQVSMEITMDANKTYTAKFKADDKDVTVTSYTLTTTASPLTSGTVTRSPDKEKYAAGDKVTITATANDGFIFDGWENGDTQASMEITMDANKTYTAKFKAEEEMQMSMTTAKSEVMIFLKGTGNATIYWGNGTSETYTINPSTVTKYSHDYSTSSIRTITITGENVTYLECYNNQLTKLDVSKNTALTRLDCTLNQLTGLDVSKNTALTRLDCDGNRLTALDVSKNSVLTELWCQGNQLTALNVSKNTALKVLYCYDNLLTTLDVSGTTALTVLFCHYNRLAALDVSGTTALTVLKCLSNRLPVLDVSKNMALTALFCDDNRLTALDVSKNTALKELNCTRNQLTALDMSSNTALTLLVCQINQFTDGALNDLFGTLHNNSGSKTIYIINNPGTATCIKSIATAKGWTVNATDYYWEFYMQK